MNQQFLPPIEVGLLLPQGSQLLAGIGLLEAFDAANRFRAARGEPPLYALRILGLQSETRSVTGPVMKTVPVSEVARVHTLVVGGMLELADQHVEPNLLRQARRLANGAERVVGLCMGSFVLGALGWLDGRRCTSHWLGLDALRQRFPAAHVQPDAIYTHDGPVLTSAGATAGIDLALHLVRVDGGERLARIVARSLVVFAHRPGGQSQFGSAVRMPAGLDARFEELVGEVRDNPNADHRVDNLAARVGMSPRHFARAFRSQMGETPAAWVSKVRVEAAQRALVGSDASISEVAHGCGFGTVETFRRTFQRVTGVGPSAYRKRFSRRTARSQADG